MNTILKFGWLALALATVMYVSPIAAQDQVMLRPGSEIRIEGRSTVNTFSCRAEEVRGFGQLADNRSVRRTAAVSNEATVEIFIPVASFDCGQDRMNRDLLSALRAKEHPVIRYRLNRAELLEAYARGASYLLRTTGQLSIAGTERTVDITVAGKTRQDGLFEVEGAATLRMSDFGIDPPTAMLGMIKVHDEITVRFDLLAASAGRGTSGEVAVGGGS
jgi:hypothetical protein